MTRDVREVFHESRVRRLGSFRNNGFAGSQVPFLKCFLILLFEPALGIEPRTTALQVQSSTTELNGRTDVFY